MHRAKRIVSSLIVGSVGFALAGLVLPRSTGAADPKPPHIASKVVQWDEARQLDADWGELRTYFTGESFGTKDVLTAVAVLEPGQAIHNAHRHAEEEYLIVVHGSGRWHLDGKEFAATRGDMLYADPWVYHGLTNTGDERLVFVVLKYNGKGVKLPPRPNDGKRDEL